MHPTPATRMMGENPLQLLATALGILQKGNIASTEAQDALRIKKAIDIVIRIQGNTPISINVAPMILQGKATFQDKMKTANQYGIPIIRDSIPRALNIGKTQRVPKATMMANATIAGKLATLPKIVGNVPHPIHRDHPHILKKDLDIIRASRIINTITTKKVTLIGKIEINSPDQIRKYM